MKVILYVPYFDGISHMRDYTLKYVNGLIDKNIQVILLVNYIGDFDFGSYKNLKIISLNKSYFNNDELKNSNKLLWLYFRVYFNFLLFLELAKILKKEEPNLVHFLSYELVSLSFLLSISRNAKYLKNRCFIEIAAANFGDDYVNQNYFIRIWRKFMKYSVKSIEKTVTPFYTFNSKTHIKLFKTQIFGVSAFDENRLIFLGDSRKIKLCNTRRKLPAVPTFLFFGTIRDDKGFDFLCESISRLSELQLNYNFIIAGKPLGFDAIQVIEKFGIQDLENVKLDLNFLDEQTIDTYFNLANYLVLPYNLNYKGSSGPVYEAAARGIPIISTNVSEMGVLVNEYNLGYLIEPNNVEDLYIKFKELITFNDSKEYSLKVSNVESFAKKFSEENYLNRLIDSYKLAVGCDLIFHQEAG